MVATSGDRLLASEAVEALRAKLIPRAGLITPNLPEAAALLDEPVAASETAIADQGRRLLAMGCRAVLIKGGHGQGAESIDYLVTGAGTIALAAPRVATRNTHGTGCSLSSAIAAGLAKGDDMETAVRHAKTWISAAIAAADRFSVGHGHGPVHHFHRFLLSLLREGQSSFTPASFTTLLQRVTSADTMVANAGPVTSGTSKPLRSQASLIAAACMAGRNSLIRRATIAGGVFFGANSRTRSPPHNQAALLPWPWEDRETPPPALAQRPRGRAIARP